MTTTDSSANESPEKKRYSSSEDIDEDREKRLAAVRVAICNRSEYLKSTRVQV